MRKTLSVVIAIILVASFVAGAFFYLIKPKPSTEAELTTLSINGLIVTKNNTTWSATVPYSTDSIDISTITATKSDKSSITYNGKTSGTISLQVGLNTIAIIVTAEDNETNNSYTLTVTREEDEPNPSTEAELTTLSIKDLTVTKSSTTWSATVPYSTDNIDISTITAIKSDKSSITYNGKTSGTINLQVGLNTITIIVTAEDNETNNSYTLAITREEEPYVPPEHINVKTWSEIPSQNATGDGVTNDSNAIRLALKKAQDDGVALYFPSGTYNCNKGNLNYYTESSTLTRKIHIFGDGQSSVLKNPGNLTVFDDITFERMAVQKRTNTLILLRPSSGTYKNVTIKNCTFSGEVWGDDGSFFSCSQPLGQGVAKAIVLNNTVTMGKHGFLFVCEITESCIMDNNIFTYLCAPVGSSGAPYSRAMCAGDTLDNEVRRTNNVTISNNSVKHVRTETGSPYGYPILVEGKNVKIINNTIEDIDMGTGIYSKSDSLLISENTLINAGDHAAICVKNTNPNASIIIENNNIKSDRYTISLYNGNVRNDGGTIRIHAVNFIIRNNIIRFYDHNEPDPIGGTTIEHCAAIYNTDRKVLKAVIENNDIYTESGYGIVITETDVNCVLEINDNKIVQNIIKPGSIASANAAAIWIRGVKSGTVIDIKHNEINIMRGRYGLRCGSSQISSILNFTDNEIKADSINGAILFSDSLITADVRNNNVFYDYTGSDTAELGLFFRFSYLFTLAHNMMTFGEKGTVQIVCRYQSESDVDEGKCIISNNTVAGRNGGGYAANRFVQFFNSASISSDIIPEFSISSNTVTLRYALLAKYSSTELVCPSNIYVNLNNISTYGNPSSSNGLTSNTDSKFIFGTGLNINTVNWLS